jgi:hypothetical protein
LCSAAEALPTMAQASNRLTPIVPNLGLVVRALMLITVLPLDLLIFWAFCRLPETLDGDSTALCCRLKP